MDRRRRQLLLRAMAGVAIAGSAVAPAWAQSRPIGQADQAKIKFGLTTDEVVQLIGKPQKIRKYGRGAEATWAYPTRDRETWFLVDIDANGRVKSAGEQYVPAY